MDARGVALGAVHSAFRSDVHKLFTTLVNALAVADTPAAPPQAVTAFRAGFEQSTQALQVACDTIDEILPPPTS